MTNLLRLGLLGLILWWPLPVWATFPVVAATNSTADSSGTTSHTVNLPAGISSGNLLLTLITCRNSSLSITFPAGWTQVGTDFTSGGVALGHSQNAIYYRIADGGEGASITVTTSGTNGCASVTKRITGHHAATAPESGTAANGSSTTPDPPNVTPSWGAEDTLWMTMGGVIDTVTTSIYPYADGNLTLATTVTNNVTMIYSEQSVNAASSNPGTYTINTAKLWGAQTVAIRPAAASSSSVGHFRRRAF